MNTQGGPNPDTVDQFLQLYEAFETIDQDGAALAARRSEGLPEGAEPEDVDAFKLDLDQQQALIEQRRVHVLGSVIGGAALDMLSIRAASLAYVAGFEDAEGQEAAAARVAKYNSTLEQVWRRGAVPPADSQQALLSGVGGVGEPDVEIYGRTDPQTGKTWVSLTDTRTVRHAQPIRSGDVVLGDYEVLSSHVNDAGQTVAVIRPGAGMPERTVTFAADSRAWRIIEGRAQLFIPADSSSLGELALEGGSSDIERIKRRLALAVDATGADLPNIADSFEEPTGNPRPIPVAKRD